jgi:shikimate kinase
VQTDKLYLVGFMGAGKSTIARALGRRLGWRVEDIDERIEARERRTVAAVFAQSGEPYYRQLAADRAAMEQLYQRRQLAYAQAHVRIDSSQPVPEVVELLLEWIGF